MLGENIQPAARARLELQPMAVTEIVPETTVITELLQALTGCSVERAELAISDPTPAGPASSEEALTSMARAMVALKSRSAAPALPE